MPLFFITQASSRKKSKAVISFNNQPLLLAPPLAPRRDGEIHVAKNERKVTEKKEVCSRICIIVRVQSFTELEVNCGGYFLSSEAER